MKLKKQIFNKTEITAETFSVRELNDQFRQRLKNPNLVKVFLTKYVELLPNKDKEKLINKVIEFNRFNENNDPYGEHDFGSIKFKKEKYFFKIDYYDKDLKYHSEDATDPSKTTRVMTIMNAEEY